MKHYTSPSFWSAYDMLPQSVKCVADRNFKILKENPYYPSLHLKKINPYWSVRAGIRYRALAIEINDDLLWFWIGSHAEYDKFIKP
nr:hypothetical protein [methane-oxidizing endosymbiont of Gigantopelta aegis]